MTAAVIRRRRLLAIGLAALLSCGTAGALAARTRDAAAARERTAADRPAIPVARVDAVGFTVSDMDRALAFYTGVLPFVAVSDVDVQGRPFELISGVFGAHARIVRLRLGEETIELTQFLAPQGRPVPADVRPNDRSFQHVAIIVRDMDRAYERLRRHGVAHASAAPQTLPDWNPSAGGIRAFYFRDPDGHYLEILQFPPGKGSPRWHAAGSELFLGIDHTAIVVSDTDASLALYRDAFGMTIAGGSENHGVEQEHLNGVFGARLRITTLRAREGPAVEFLEYLAPSNGRSAPDDLQSNDLLHWQTTMVAETLDGVLPLARAHRLRLISPGPVGVTGRELGFPAAATVRDRDGHGLRLVAR